MDNYEFKESDLPRLKKEYRQVEEPEIKKKKKKKKKSKKNNIILNIMLIFSLGFLTFSFIKITIWFRENKNIAEQIKEIENITEITEIKDDENIENVNPPQEENKEDDYWDYLKLPLIEVNFTSLLKKNKDTVAYLKVNGTNINYPVVQTNDNKYYLNHAFDKSVNSAGWVFMDYRNDKDNFQDNTIIYAHGRVNSTMFGSLKNIFKSDWYQNKDNYIINLSTLTENTLWQVFSVYQIPTETYYLKTSFSSLESKQEFIKTIKGRSKYDFKTNVDINDKILTLSTCANKTEKVVLHAKLIKKQVRGDLS